MWFLREIRNKLSFIEHAYNLRYTHIHYLLQSATINGLKLKFMHRQVHQCFSHLNNKLYPKLTNTTVFNSQRK